jgi:hypothetical protein
MSGTAGPYGDEEQRNCNVGRVITFRGAFRGPVFGRGTF